MKITVLMAVATICGVCALPAAAASVAKTYSYFSVGGHTLEEIEAELSRRGPQISGSERRHPGATRMEFTTRITYGETGGRCRVADAKVTVKANVILPRWRQRARAERDVRLIWDTLSSDIKRHEESHIVIAKNHARELEQALKALPRAKACPTVAARVKDVTGRILAAHDEAQLRFDRIEGLGFEKRMMRLLEYRLQQIEAAAYQADPTAEAAQAFTPSFFCRLVDDVVYWKTTFWSGLTIRFAACAMRAAS